MNTRAVLSPSAKVGITTVAVAIVVTMVGFFFNWFGGQKKGFEIRIHFDSIRGLVKDATVLHNGRPVGNVQTYDAAEDQGVYVKVQINDPKTLIHKNATAVITAESVLGQKIISISEPLSGSPQYPMTEPGTWKDPNIPEFAETSPDPQEPTFRFEAGRLLVGDPIFRQVEDRLIQIGKVIRVTPLGEGKEDVTFDLSGDPIDPREAVVAEYAMRSNLGTGRVAKVYKWMENGELIEGIKEPEASDIIASVNQVVQDINRLIGTLTPQIESITTHLDEVLVGVNEVLDKDQVNALFASLQRELASAGNNVDLITNDLRNMLAATQPILEDTLISARNSAQSVESITGEAERVISDPETRARLEAMLAELESTTKRLDAITEDIESITGDPEVQGDIKGTIKAARDTLEGADQTLKRVNDFSANLGGYQLGINISERYDVDSERAYTDAGVELNKPGEHRFGLGVSNIGEGSRLEASYGLWLSDELLVRAGIHRGKPGLGSDFYISPFGIRTDLYDPNDPMLDIYGGYDITEQLRAEVGFEDVLDEGTDRVNVGATVRF